MKKKILYLFMIGLTILLTSGCSTDNMDGIEAITTSYPMEYITNELYGKHSNVKKLYPVKTIYLYIMV